MYKMFAAVAVAALAMGGCSERPLPSASSTAAPTTAAAAAVPTAGTQDATTAAGAAARTAPMTTEPGPTTGPTPTPPGSCETPWSTDPESDAATSPSALYNSRIGRHDCFDRVVFDVNGPEPVGYDVRYVPVVGAEGSGHPVPVAGDAALQVVVRAPAQGSAGDTSGHQPGVVFAPSGARLHGPAGLENWGCLREVRSAGSFEGQTTFAVGVRETLPFRVHSFTDASQITHVVVDIAC